MTVEVVLSSHSYSNIHHSNVARRITTYTTTARVSRVTQLCSLPRAVSVAAKWHDGAAISGFHEVVIWAYRAQDAATRKQELALVLF
jgi:hypothetical protein